MGLEGLVKGLLVRPKAVYAVVSRDERTVFYLGNNERKAEQVTMRMSGKDRSPILQKYIPQGNGSVAQVNCHPQSSDGSLFEVYARTYYCEDLVRRIMEGLDSKYQQFRQKKEQVDFDR